MNSEALKTVVGGLELRAPVVIASGIWPYEEALWDPKIVGSVGAICSKAITDQPRSGNGGIRIWETPSGLLNSIGLQNDGVQSFMGRLPELKRRGLPVLLNLSMETPEALAAMLKAIAARADLVDGIELNVSCPNVDRGGMTWGVDPDLTAQAVAQVRRSWQGPLWVKLTPQAPDIIAVAQAAEAAGASALVVANTWLAMAIDVNRGRPVFDRRVAGLSGPAVFPLALRLVWDVVSAVSIPVVGCGGVHSADDALAMIMAGAQAVEIGTALFADVTLPQAIGQGLEEALQSRGLTSVSELVGLARS